VAPAYPWLISFFCRMFRDESRAFVAISVFSSALAALQYSLLPWLARACKLPVRIGILGGFLGALLPIDLWVQTKGSFEYALAGLMFLVFSIVYVRFLSRAHKGAVWLGLVSGATLLVNPQIAAPMLALAILIPFLLTTDSRRVFIRSLLAQFLIAGACVLPWTIRNALVLGSPIWSRSNFGLELHLSNNDLAAATWDQNERNGLFLAMHPHANAAEREKVRELGEVAYNREKLRDAREWILSHPRRFATLTAERAFLFWFPLMKRPVQTAGMAAITLVGILGFIRFWRTGALAAHFFVILAVSLAAPLCLFQTSSRLRYPIEWLFYFFAAYLCFSLLIKNSRRNTEDMMAVWWRKHLDSLEMRPKS